VYSFRLNVFAGAGNVTELLVVRYCCLGERGCATMPAPWLDSAQLLGRPQYLCLSDPWDVQRARRWRDTRARGGKGNELKRRGPVTSCRHLAFQPNPVMYWPAYHHGGLINIGNIWSRWNLLGPKLIQDAEPRILIGASSRPTFADVRFYISCGSPTQKKKKKLAKALFFCPQLLMFKIRAKKNEQTRSSGAKEC